MLQAIVITVSQTKFAKVIFLHLSVCPQGGGGVPGQVHPPRQVHPPGKVHPHPKAGTPPRQIHPWQVHPLAGISLAGTPPGQVHPPWQVHPQQVHHLVCTPQGPPRVGTPLAGTPQAGIPPGQVPHPPPRAVHAGRYGQQVGMHSC